MYVKLLNETTFQSGLIIGQVENIAVECTDTKLQGDRSWSQGAICLTVIDIKATVQSAIEEREVNTGIVFSSHLPLDILVRISSG